MKRLADIDTIVAVKQGSLNRDETLMIRRNMRDDFIVSDPSEYWFLDDLRKGGQVVWGEMSYIVYGKKRTLVKEYIALARQGKWEEAYGIWDQLNPIREFLANMVMAQIARTASYASTVSSIKVWFETIGLKAGPVVPPVRNLSAGQKEELKAQILKLGVA
jgi:4-hydroxy-tetrahydrodipicolinate synthase